MSLGFQKGAFQGSAFQLSSGTVSTTDAFAFNDFVYNLYPLNGGSPSAPIYVQQYAFNDYPFNTFEFNGGGGGFIPPTTHGAGDWIVRARRRGRR